MAGNQAAVIAFNQAVFAAIIAAEALDQPTLAMQPPGPIDQDPEEVIDCVKLSRLINILQDLGIKHCPGV